MGKNKKVLRFDGNYDFYMNKGVEYAKDGDYLKALRYLFGASEKKPSDVDTMLHVALVYQKMGLLEMSNSALYSVLAVHHENQAACVMLGQNYSLAGDSLRELYYLKNYSEIAEDVDLMEIFENSVGFMPQYEQVYPMPAEHRDALYRRGVKLMSEGRMAEAKECFGEILEAYPDDADAKNHMCQIFLVEDKPAGALDAAREILRRDGSNLFAWCNLAMALHFIGNVGQRDDAVEKIKTFDPGDGEDAGRVIKIMCLTGNHAHAFALAEKYLKKHPYDMEYTTLAAVSAYNAGLYEKAKSRFLTMNSVMPGSLTLEYYLGVTQDAMEGRAAPSALPYDLKLPADEENRLKIKAAACDFSDVYANAETKKLAQWAVSGDNLLLAEATLDKIIAADAKRARRTLDNLLAQNCGWQLKRLILEKRLANYPNKDVHINKDGYSNKPDMPPKNPPKNVAASFRHAFAALSVFFVDDDRWIDKLSGAADSLGEKAELLAEAGAGVNETAALMVRIAGPDGFDDRQICVVFRVPYNRLAALTEIIQS